MAQRGSGKMDYAFCSCAGDPQLEALPHVVWSIDLDDPEGTGIWAVLANHAEYAVAEPALKEYAIETEGVERVMVTTSKKPTGLQLRESLEADLREMATWDGEPLAVITPGQGPDIEQLAD